mmetsp:Transcript_2372/g.3039  ORF Transcript_2372/g.3039 Transcript_2372/m.3039 type:complete len:102 (-) Transcript_2372:67-372(-)
MASPHVFMALIYAPMQMMLSSISLYLFKTFLINLSNASKQQVPQDYRILRTIQPYLKEVNKLMEEQLLGPADKIKVNITHVLLASILITLLAILFSRAKMR